MDDPNIREGPVSSKKLAEGRNKRTTFPCLGVSGKAHFLEPWLNATSSHPCCTSRPIKECGEGCAGAVCLGGGEIEAWRRPCSPTTRTDSLPAAHKRTCSPPTISAHQAWALHVHVYGVAGGDDRPSRRPRDLTRSHASAARGLPGRRGRRRRRGEEARGRLYPRGRRRRRRRARRCRRRGGRGCCHRAPRARA